MKQWIIAVAGIILIIQLIALSQNRSRLLKRDCDVRFTLQPGPSSVTVVWPNAYTFTTSAVATSGTISYQWYGRVMGEFPDGYGTIDPGEMLVGASDSAVAHTGIEGGYIWLRCVATNDTCYSISNQVEVYTEED